MFGATHGSLSGAESIARSCNIFYYTLGRRLGPDGIVDWYRKLGLGEALRVGLAEGVDGDLPDPDRRLAVADAMFMGIGQGPVRWTPLQAANAYATLVRRGRRLDPVMVAGPSREKRIDEDLGLDPGAVAEALKGLYEAANEDYGTAHHLSLLGREPIFNIEGVKVYGKSGTAEAVPLRVDGNGDGRITTDDPIRRAGDHAWFIGLAEREYADRPGYIVAVVVEYAGSGGAVAGPIANQVMHALRAEGYF